MSDINLNAKIAALICLYSRRLSPSVSSTPDHCNLSNLSLDWGIRFPTVAFLNFDDFRCSSCQ